MNGIGTNVGDVSSNVSASKAHAPYLGPRLRLVLLILLGVVLIAVMKEASPGICDWAVGAPRPDLLSEASQGDLQTIRGLLAGGASPNVADECGGTPLIYAVESANKPVIRALIDAGADVSAISETGLSPLRSAVFTGDVEIVRMILDAGADPNKCATGHCSPIAVALDQGDQSIIDELVKHGAIVPIATDDQRRKLMTAAEQ